MAQQPNILLITTDQQHFDTIGALGHPTLVTPALDQLVREGVSFTRAYTANPVCSPSRASLLTGEYPSRHQCWNIGVGLNRRRVTLSAILSRAGYQTALCGKAHLQPVLDPESFESAPRIYDRAFWRQWTGPYYGFQHVQLVHGHGDEESAAGMHYGAWLADRGIDITRYFGPGGGHREGAWDLPESLHYTRWTADQALAFLNTAAQNSRPFFLWCSFQDPHNAFLCPEPWASRYDPTQLPDFVARPGEMADKTRWHRALWEGQLPDLGISYVPDPDHPTGGIQCLGYTTPGIGEARARRWLATYYGMISLIDHHVGRLLTGLDALGLTRDTIVLFTTDHGEYAGNHGLWLKGPLHYEDIIRVPFIVRWPGVVPANVRSESLISLVDVAPTLLDVIGCSVPVTMQGVSQRETWRNPAHACRSWCLVENRAEPSVYVKSLVTPRYKLNYFLGWGEGELYDLQEDPHEFVNLYHTSGVATTVQPDLFRQLVDITGSLENPYPPRRAFA